MEIQHDLDAVLGTELTNSPTPVAGVPNLQAMNIDAEQATGEYRERTVGPYRGVLPPQELKLLEERLSGACTVEVAAFDEFALLLSNPDRTQEFDHVIFDTAPTGHTLRLLELPAAWTGFLESATWRCILEPAARTSTKPAPPVSSLFGSRRGI
jgi:arsenite-transporting ATPase